MLLAGWLAACLPVIPVSQPDCVVAWDPNLLDPMDPNLLITLR